MTRADWSISSFERKLPSSSSMPATMGTATPSIIGIIFSVVTSCLAICVERKPPETPPYETKPALVVPFLVHVVERVVEGRRRVVVVLGQYEDVGIRRCDTRRPALRVLVLVLLQARMLRFVIDGQLEVGQVDGLHLEPTMRSGELAEPCSHGGTHAAGSGADGDHLELRGHGRASLSWFIQSRW